MKTILFFLLASVALVMLPGCASDDEVVRTTTVTEETSVSSPATVVPTRTVTTY